MCLRQKHLVRLPRERRKPLCQKSAKQNWFLAAIQMFIKYSTSTSWPNHNFLSKNSGWVKIFGTEVFSRLVFIKINLFLFSKQFFSNDKIYHLVCRRAVLGIDKHRTLSAKLDGYTSLYSNINSLSCFASSALYISGKVFNCYGWVTPLCWWIMYRTAEAEW